MDLSYVNLRHHILILKEAPMEVYKITNDFYSFLIVVINTPAPSENIFISTF